MLPPAFALLLAAAASGPGLETVLQSRPADSLVTPLKLFESRHGHEPAGAEAALLLGKLHYARGEYRQAVEAFARAAARFDPSRKDEARTWLGLSWLAVHEP